MKQLELGLLLNFEDCLVSRVEIHLCTNKSAYLWQNLDRGPVSIDDLIIFLSSGQHQEESRYKTNGLLNMIPFRITGESTEEGFKGGVTHDCSCVLTIILPF